MLFSAVLAGFISGAGLIIAIGAQNAFILRQGLLRRHVGLVVSVAAGSDILLIMCGIVGIGVLVKEWSLLMQVLRFGGAAFLGLYGLKAAWRAFRSSDVLVSERNASNGSWRRVLLTCLAFTFLNPHVYLDTVVLLGSLSTHYAGDAHWMFGLGACFASVVWFSVLGYGARFLQPLFASVRAWRVLDGMIAVFMLSMSAVLLINPLC